MQSTLCTSVPGLWLPLFLLLWLPWVYKFTWTSASSFFFCASACAFASSSTLLSWRRGFSKDGAKAESPDLLFKKNLNGSVALSTSTQLFKHYHHPPPHLPHLLKLELCLSSLPPSRATSILRCFYESNYYYRDFTRWNHTVFVLL